MINARNSKMINMKMFKKGLQHHKMWGKKVRKSRFFFLRMWLSLYGYQAKANIYRKGLTYFKNRATTNQTKHYIHKN